MDLTIIVRRRPALSPEHPGDQEKNEKKQYFIHVVFKRMHCRSLFFKSVVMKAEVDLYRRSVLSLHAGPGECSLPDEPVIVAKNYRIVLYLILSFAL